MVYTRVAGFLIACYKIPAMGEKKMISTTQFAKSTGIPYQTVVRWAQDGIIPGVEREETLRGPVWLIPQSSLDTIERWKPKLGRPPKPKTK